MSASYTFANAQLARPRSARLRHTVSLITPSRDTLDCREPGRCAVVVKSRLNAIGHDRSDMPSDVAVERHSQIVATDRMRATVGTLVTEAQHVESSIVFRH